MRAHQGPPSGTLGPPPFRGPPANARAPPSGIYGPPPSGLVPMTPPGTLPHPSLLRSGLQPPPPGAPGVPLQMMMEPPAPGGPPISTLSKPRSNGLNTYGDKAETHVPLAKCRVLYIGSAVPTETAVGLDAVQQPLNDRYNTNGLSATNVPGIDAWLTVFSSGILMQYTADKSVITWFPIPTLHVSAAVKCVPFINSFNQQNQCKFMSLDSPGSKASEHPPVFAAIMRRTSGVKVLECHSFICKSEQAALALVQSTTHAYEHKEGWQDEAPPPKELYQTLEGTINTADPNAEPDLPIFQPSDKVSSDKPPVKGHFYNSRPEMIRSFNVHHPVKYPNAMMNQQVPPPKPVPRPLPMVPTNSVGYSNPYLLPTRAPPPAGYFEDWDVFKGQPVMVFPGPYMSDTEYKKTVREVRNKRRPRTNDRRRGYDRTYDRPPVRGPERDRTYERERERTYERRPPRPVERMEYNPYETRYREQPPSNYMDDLGNRYYQGRQEADYGYSYREEIPRAIERREYYPEDPDMVLYAPRYMNHIDPDPDVGRPSRREPEFYDEGPDYDRRYPRNDREFGHSMAEERRLIGDNDRPDPYKMNDYRRRDDMEMFRDGGYGDLTQHLGYFP